MFEDAAYETQPGSVISPTDITDKVAADLESIKKISFHVPTVYGAIDWEEEKRFARKVAWKQTLNLQRKRLQKIFAVAALASVLIGIYLALAGWHSNHVAQAQAANLSKQAAGSANPGSAPSAAKLAPSLVAAYRVAPSLPRYIDIPSLNVHARVLALGTTSSGALAAPGNINDVGWYKQSAKPGQNGAMLIDGHISNWQANGVFYGLSKLSTGDTISITRGDGKIFSYKVLKSQTFDSSNVDMASLLVSADSGKPGLNLISCSGDVIAGTNEFNKRLVVYAVQI